MRTVELKKWRIADSKHLETSELENGYGRTAWRHAMRANPAQAGLTRTVQMRTGGARAWKNKCRSGERGRASTARSHACAKTNGRTSDAAVGATELAVRLSATQIAQMSCVPLWRLAGGPGFGAAAAAAGWGGGRGCRVAALRPRRRRPPVGSRCR